MAPLATVSARYSPGSKRPHLGDPGDSGLPVCRFVLGPRRSSAVAREPRTAPSTCQVGLVCCRRLAVGIGSLQSHATDFRPDPELLGPGSYMLGGRDVIAAEVEEVIDLIVC